MVKGRSKGVIVTTRNFNWMQRGNMNKRGKERAKSSRSMNSNPGGGQRIAGVGVLEGMNFYRHKADH